MSSPLKFSSLLVAILSSTTAAHAAGGHQYLNLGAPLPVQQQMIPVAPQRLTAPVTVPAVPPQILTTPGAAAAIQDLRKRHLLMPIAEVSPERLKGSFYEMRGTGRHEASDILAPRNTPIMAIEDGKIVRLFHSRLGGNTIYQYDPSEKYVYYYAHLEKYEPSINEGDEVKKGQVIGYVGTSGNAPPNTPHLHLSISILTPEKKWWQASSIDPYEVFK